MDISELKTERLIVRPFKEYDLKAIYNIFGDRKVNRFLPWFPLKTMEETKDFYENHLKNKNHENTTLYYAICLKTDNIPIGYINITMNDSYDLGYGLCEEFWHNGIVTEAARAVIVQLKKNHIPYITATHDVNNPKSGEVMKRLGMKYCYSYEEQWQPKDILVTFRLYQLNLDDQKDRIYKKYWENSSVHYIEHIDS